MGPYENYTAPWTKLHPKRVLELILGLTQLSWVQNGPAQEYKKTIPDKLTLLGNLLGQNKAILAKK